jgi:hypothetical protein
MRGLSLHSEFLIQPALCLSRYPARKDHAPQGEMGPRPGRVIRNLSFAAFVVPKHDKWQFGVRAILHANPRPRPVPAGSPPPCDSLVQKQASPVITVQSERLCGLYCGESTTPCIAGSQKSMARYLHTYSAGGLLCGEMSVTGNTRDPASRFFFR